MFANDCHIFAVMERTLHFDHVILKPEQQIGLHSQSTWELSLVVKGKGNRITGDMSEPFEEGDLALIPPELPHCWKFSPDCGTIENLTVLFSADFLHSVAAVFPEMQEFFVRLAGWDEAIVFSGNTRRTLATACFRWRCSQKRCGLFHCCGCWSSSLNATGNMRRVGKNARPMRNSEGKI